MSTARDARHSGLQTRPAWPHRTMVVWWGGGHHQASPATPRDFGTKDSGLENSAEAPAATVEALETRQSWMHSRQNA